MAVGSQTAGQKAAAGGGSEGGNMGQNRAGRPVFLLVLFFPSSSRPAAGDYIRDPPLIIVIIQFPQVIVAYLIAIVNKPIANTRS